MNDDILYSLNFYKILKAKFNSYYFFKSFRNRENKELSKALKCFQIMKRKYSLPSVYHLKI